MIGFVSGIELGSGVTMLGVGSGVWTFGFGAGAAAGFGAGVAAGSGAGAATGSGAGAAVCFGAGAAAGFGSCVTGKSLVSEMGEGRGGGDLAFTGATEIDSTERLLSSAGVSVVTGSEVTGVSTSVSFGFAVSASDIAITKSKSESQFTS